MEGALVAEALKGSSSAPAATGLVGARRGEECERCRGPSNAVHPTSGFPIVGRRFRFLRGRPGPSGCLDRSWTLLKAVPDDALETTIANTGLADKGPYSVADLVAAVRLRREGESEQEESHRRRCATRSTRPCCAAPRRSRDNDQFVCADVGRAAGRDRSWFSRASAVSRLREVRALFGVYSGVPPESGGSERWAALSAEPVGWLPGMEVLGEGIFLVLDEEALRRWESRSDVVERCAVRSMPTTRRASAPWASSPTRESRRASSCSTRWLTS